MPSVFARISSFFSAVVPLAVEPVKRERLTKSLEIAQGLLVPAIQACAVVAQLTPNRTDDEIFRLVQLYGLGLVTYPMLRNESVVTALLKAAAMKELQISTQRLNVDPRILDLAVQSAFLVYKETHAR